MSYWNFMMKETKKMNYSIKHTPSETKTYTTDAELSLEFTEKDHKYRLWFIQGRVHYQVWDSGGAQYVDQRYTHRPSIPLEVLKSFMKELEERGL